MGKRGRISHERPSGVLNGIGGRWTETVMSTFLLEHCLKDYNNQGYKRPASALRVERLKRSAG